MTNVAGAPKDNAQLEQGSDGHPVQRDFDSIESGDARNKGLGSQERNLSRESRETAGSRTTPGTGPQSPYSPSSPAFDTTAGPLSPGNAWAFAVQNAEQEDHPTPVKPYTAVVDGHIIDRQVSAGEETQVPYDEGDDTWTGYSGARPSGYNEIVSNRGESASLGPADATWPGDAVQGVLARTDPGPTSTSELVPLPLREDTWRLDGDAQPRPPNENNNGLLDASQGYLRGLRPGDGPISLERPETPEPLVVLAQHAAEARDVSSDFFRHSFDTEVIMHTDFTPVMEHNR